MLNRIGWAFCGALSVIAVLALARASIAGPLDPPGPVGSSMRTLNALLPSWSSQLDSAGACSSQRFDCVMGADEAVLDLETGLVWMRAPDTGYLTYAAANFFCNGQPHAGRYGWRLPTLIELYSLADDSPDDNLPDGSPFVDAGGGVYWSSTLSGSDDQDVVTLAFFGGYLEELVKGREGEDSFSNTWCVRGGQALDDDPQYAELPAWARTLSSAGGCASQRFECVMNGLAVLDRETGLVWERDPDFPLAQNQGAAEFRCDILDVGGRSGWRLPTLHEVGSLLIDGGSPQGLPTGHPFTIGSILVWTSSTSTADHAILRYVTQDATTFVTGAAVVPAEAWCVRGPGGATTTRP